MICQSRAEPNWERLGRCREYESIQTGYRVSPLSVMTNVTAPRTLPIRVKSYSDLAGNRKRKAEMSFLTPNRSE